MFTYAEMLLMYDALSAFAEKGCISITYAGETVPTAELLDKIVATAGALKEGA